MQRVLIVDDEHVVRLVLTEILESNGFAVTGVSNGREALEVFRKERPASVLLDLKMPDMDGRETLLELKKIDPDVPVIIVTAYGDIPTAVEAIKYGAYDFIVKPPKLETLVLTLKRAVERVELEREVRRLNTAVESSLEWLLGRSQGMKKVIQQIHQVAWSDFTIIIEGETGTGKSFIAQQIHSLSRRADKPFTSVDMGVIPEALVESELFGYEKGAFTGADRKKKGYFEITNGGTILIDELQNMSPLVQSKLLSVVEQKRIFPVGGTSPVDVDVRIIAATNTDIKESVKEKKFREDLYFRLSEFVITLPPLRERVDDIPFLANRFLMDAGAELNKQMKAIDDDSILLLMRYPWPGNVRELKNVIRRAVLLSDNGVVRSKHIDLLIDNKAEDGGDLPILPLKELSAMAAKDVEKKAIQQAMKMSNGNKTKAASMLQIDYKTLLTKIKEYSL
ncbi:MAG: sigma-54-dependent Fis family transcriptional regulator [Nitrospirae bacterium]|nr:sigma-54-dependent Fis family transcriptional regulator [Nitrospirota bacterium]